MGTDGASYRYYGALEGSWSGKYRFAITDARTLRASGLTLRDCIRVRSMGIASRVGGLRISTTVDCSRAGEHAEVLHTTRLSQWGVTLFRSVDTIHLSSDGRAFLLRSKQHFWPAPCRTSDFGEARGIVNDEATGATYWIPWFGGVEIVQRTRVVPSGLELSQETAWSFAETILVRQRPAGSRRITDSGRYCE